PPRRGCPSAPSTPLRATPARLGIPGELRSRGGGVRPRPGGVPFKSRERRATAPPPPESSPCRAALRCARLALRPPLRFPHPATDWQPPRDIRRWRLQSPRGERHRDHC
ncbi:Hypothetical predicted protein, partial [Marmota monax]